MQFRIFKMILLIVTFIVNHSANSQSDKKLTYKEYLSEGAPTKKEIDVFLKDLSWARFDGELGYILENP